MKFDIKKEKEEIAKLHAEAEENIKQHRELNQKMRITMAKIELLFDMR